MESERKSMAKDFWQKNHAMIYGIATVIVVFGVPLSNHFTKKGVTNTILESTAQAVERIPKIELEQVRMCDKLKVVAEDGCDIAKNNNNRLTVIETELRSLNKKVDNLPENIANLLK